MRTRSKRYRACRQGLDTTKLYEIDTAIDLLKGYKKPKFDESVEVVMCLGIDPRKADQQLRGTVVLPRGLGKTVRLAVFAEGPDAEAAREAGADVVGSADLIQKIQDGWLDFDVAIATPGLMTQVSRLGKILGPKGKMPSPKSGTVTDKVGVAVREFKAGKIEYRNDATGNLHAAVGKISFEKEALKENVHTFIEHVRALRPAGAKGTYIKSITLSTSMGPGVALETQ